LRLKCTKFDFGWGSAPDPAGGAYSAPPDLLAGFGGPTSKNRGREGKRGENKGGEGRRGKGEERAMSPPLFGGSLRLCPRETKTPKTTTYRKIPLRRYPPPRLRVLTITDPQRGRLTLTLTLTDPRGGELSEN